MVATKLLVGIDGSDGSYKAAAFAAKLAVKMGGSVTLMFVLPDTGSHTDRFIANPTYTPNDEILAGQKLEQAQEIMKKNDVPFDTNIAMGNPARALLQQSKKGYEMIIVGSRGLSATQEFLMGSVSSRVAHHSEIPVVVVP